ncbi:HAD-IB family hydrolase [Streptomyces albidochromogenes]|uniref:HAD family hydrolase n=1 Tax=Streptomyces albidochromogenes TaxID=329524 RepID=UPI001FCB66C8|nr:HAD family hydrolase [Streptomyces albidochromogenes]
MPTPPYLVFADVDETLINCKSMFEFMRFQLVAEHGPYGATEYARIRAELQRKADEGVPREEINRAYYSHFAGDPVAGVHELGARWYAERNAAGLYIESTRDALRAHRAQGAEIVLVSGSFDAVLNPVVAEVGARHLLCTRPVVRDGRYTGEVEKPMIGEAKAAAVRELLAARPWIDPADCYGYGDHASDLPMLDCVGHPVAVGADPAMLAYVSRRRAAELDRV